MQSVPDLQGKRVLVVGLARTGVAASLFCSARGARVTATLPNLRELHHLDRDGSGALWRLLA